MSNNKEIKENSNNSCYCTLCGNHQIRNAIHVRSKPHQKKLFEYMQMKKEAYHKKYNLPSWAGWRYE